MTTHQRAIRDRLDEFGWKLDASDDPDAWWADDIWRLLSVWRPVTCNVYLTFLVDPQSNIHQRKPGEDVWAVKASVTLPKQAAKADGDYVLDFGHGWQKQLPDLFSSLAGMRDKCR